MTYSGTLKLTDCPRTNNWFKAEQEVILYEVGLFLLLEIALTPTKVTGQVVESLHPSLPSRQIIELSAHPGFGDGTYPFPTRIKTKRKNSKGLNYVRV